MATGEVSDIAATAPERALDARYYTDPEIFALERERIFFRTWQYAGHVSRVESPGDYFTFGICEQNLFTIRGKDGALRSFYNVCQHRAHELLQGAGNKRLLVCPYHAWTYDLDGRLRKAPNDKKVAGFDRGAICLTEVRTEVFCGFVFVNLDRDAAPMAACFPEAESQLRGYVPDIDRLKPVAWMPVEEDCNWKVTVENYSECYHCKINHPTFARGVIDPASYNVAPQGHCLRHTTRAANLDRLTYEIDPRANEHATDYSSWFFWPGFSFQVYPGNVLNTYLWRPLEVGKTLVYRGWYGPDGAPSQTVDKLARQDLDTTVAEDLRLVNSVQRGLASRGYRPGPLVIDPDQGVDSEHSIQAIKGWVLEALAGR
ncbi:MAG: aromatic ring-hydroxylating dioxygenase subunit alpha [Rhodospirillales bacterium]|nr:aromatic ring-hydroxylating dioxygenase subunit alpha [Rhodospirillales bacterium]